MGIKSANTIYLFISMLWSAIAFTILLPDVKFFAYSKCVWKFNFKICDRFLGIEGSYRFTLSIVTFYFILSLATINLNHKYSTWIHEDCWIWKIVLFLLTNLVAFVLPFSKIGMKIMYHIFLCLSMIFIIAMFILAIDAAHAFKLLWLRRARDTADKATCYLCTLLFLLHLTTSIMYAISLNLVLAFFFFNKIGECINSIIYLFVNIFVCFICVGLSYFPNLQERHSSSHVIFASIIVIVSYTTWLGLSDPENEFCNLYGTIFSGSLLDDAINFRSIISITIEFILLLFLCYQGNTRSYIRSLISNTESTEFTLYIYSKFHIIMAVASCFFLMSVTNYYEPVHSVLTKSDTMSATTAAIYFEGYNWVRFVLMCIISSSLPFMYAALLVTCIIRDCLNERRDRMKEVAKESKSNKKSFSDLTYIEVSREKAVKMLRKIGNNSQVYSPLIDSDNHRIQCIHIKNIEISFWNFPKHVSQTYFNGRNGSNACTIIAIMIGRYFSRSDIPFQDNGYLQGTWSSLFHNSINEGNDLYDNIVKDFGVLDLSIEEVYVRLGKKLNMARVMPSLAVSFQSDVESATVFFQVDRLVKLYNKQVVLFIHKRRTSAFLIYKDGSVIYTDSHAFGNNGSLMVASYEFNIRKMVKFIRDILGHNENMISTLTVVEYQDRQTIY